MQELDEAALDDLLRSLDSDGDGRISYDDFVLQFDSLAGRLNGSNEDDFDDDYGTEPEVIFKHITLMAKCSVLTGLDVTC